MTQTSDKAHNYCAIFGDIVRSRSVENRAELQERLIAVLEDVNRKFAAEIVAPFRIIAGDEVRGLLRDESRSYDLIVFIQEALLPERMRFAVGIGEISTAVSEDINLVDGPALHRATDAMAILKNRKRAHGRQILFSSGRPEWDQIVNAIAFLLASVRSRWSRGDIEKLAVLKEKSSLDEVAEQFGISQQAIAKLVMKLDYYAVEESEATLSRILSRGVDNNHIWL